MAKRHAPSHVLTFRVPDPRRIRALFNNAAPYQRRHIATRRTLERAGLSDDEIRILQGFRGLSAEQQASLLAWTSATVIIAAQQGGRS